jgi:hypothetical protein
MQRDAERGGLAGSVPSAHSPTRHDQQYLSVEALDILNDALVFLDGGCEQGQTLGRLVQDSLPPPKNVCAIDGGPPTSPECASSPARSIAFAKGACASGVDSARKAQDSGAEIKLDQNQVAKEALNARTAPIQSGAQQHGVGAPRQHSPGTSRKRESLTAESVIQIFLARRDKLQRRGLAGRLARQYGVTSKAVRDIWTLRTWKRTTQPFWNEASFWPTGSSER